MNETHNPSKTKELYLDYSATTPCDPDAITAMMHFYTTEFGNSGSSSHSFGKRAHDAVESARQQIADVIHCSKNELIFTSGATESNNIAIKGAMKYLNKYYQKNHIITLKTEHKCVLEACKDLESEGFEVTYLDVNSNGLIDLNQLKEAIKPTTGLTSVAYVHNEIGVIQPIADIYTICKENNVLFHTDAAQALGRLPVLSDYADMISLSAHKFYGPKGIGALYIRRKVRLLRIISGGGQEKGLRSGTVPVALCVGMGIAAKKAEQMREAEQLRMRYLRDIMLHKIMTELPEVYLNGDLINRIPDNLNLSFSCVEGESLMVYLDGIAVSSGSACTSNSLEPSYVLRAINVDDDLIHTSIRIVMGRYTTEQDIMYATNKFIAAVKYLRSISPLWDLRLQGIDLKTVKWIDIH